MEQLLNGVSSLEGWEYDENDAEKEEERTIIHRFYHYKCHVIIISCYVLIYYHLYIYIYLIIGWYWIEIGVAAGGMQCNAITFLSQRIRPNYLLYQETWCISHAECIQRWKGWDSRADLWKTSGVQWISGGEFVCFMEVVKEPWNICCGIWLNLHTEHNLIF